MLSTRSVAGTLARESLTKKGTSTGSERRSPRAETSSPTRSVCGPGGTPPSTSSVAVRLSLDSDTAAGAVGSAITARAVSASSAAGARTSIGRPPSTTSLGSTLTATARWLGMAVSTTP